MLQTLMPLIVLLSWLALPVTVVCIVDDWLLRPQRAIAASARTARDAPLMRLLYGALPVLIVAAVLRLLLAERLDFSAVLLAITVATGLVWALDALAIAPRRSAAARAAGRDPTLTPEPGTVDYARSFFPVALVVLLLRSFVFEPFRIPSDSMMPTLPGGARSPAGAAGVRPARRARLRLRGRGRARQRQDGPVCRRRAAGALSDDGR